MIIKNDKPTLFNFPPFLLSPNDIKMFLDHCCKTCLAGAVFIATQIYVATLLLFLPTVKLGGVQDGGDGERGKLDAQTSDKFARQFVQLCWF